MKKWDNRENRQSYNKWFDFGVLFRGSRKMRLLGNFLMFSGIFNLAMLLWTLTMLLFDTILYRDPGGLP